MVLMAGGNRRGVQAMELKMCRRKELKTCRRRLPFFFALQLSLGIIK